VPEGRSIKAYSNKYLPERPKALRVSYYILMFKGL
jgi:hypothetical protein